MAEAKERPEAQAVPQRISSRKTGKLVGGFNRSLERSADDLVTRFGGETAVVMRREMLDEYRRLIPEVPYIGGWRVAIALGVVMVIVARLEGLSGSVVAERSVLPWLWATPMTTEVTCLG